ncbi:MAG: tetratricopeptide repeat protein [Flavobacteriales bacterium]
MKANKETFKRYLLNKRQKDKHAFEKQHLDDELVSDAIEGFQANEGAWNRFEKLEKQFAAKRKNTLNKYLLLSTLGVLLVGVYYIVSKDDSDVNRNQKSKTTEIHVAKAPIKLYKKQDLVTLQPLTLNEQITATIVVEDFHQKRIENIPQEKFASPMEQLPVNGISIQTNKSRKLERKIARELLIRNFKVIDYRYYRKSDEPKNLKVEEADGNEMTRIPYINILSEAIEDFSQGNYKLSLLAFDQILSNFPNDANALFYSALSLYNLNESGETKNRLEKLRINEFANFEEEADWYLLLVYKQQKNEAAFGSLKKVIIETNGFYAEKAKMMNL